MDFVAVLMIPLTTKEEQCTPFRERSPGRTFSWHIWYHKQAMSSSQIRQKIQEVLQELQDCTVCPRECHADRSSARLGYCQTGTGFSIGSICAHMGEEPILSGRNGICNVFFTRCNMQCIFCQNYQISRNHGPIREHTLGLDEVIEQIELILDSGVTAVGFVSPSHCIPQMKVIIAALAERKKSPTYVMNTNAYDKVETLVSLRGIIDVYLPDLKYMDKDLAVSYSDAPDYPEIATTAIKEMYRQCGAHVELDCNGLIRSGLIIRHLVLPGHVENSKRCLQFIAQELSPTVYVSLMSQYHPTPSVVSHPNLGRTLYQSEYAAVLSEMERLGFKRGFTQALESPGSYLPNFVRLHPFENP